MICKTPQIIFPTENVGVKQDSPALPASDLRDNMGNIANRGKADEALALPLQQPPKWNV